MKREVVLCALGAALGGCRDAAPPAPPARAGAGDWVTYRGNAQRTGATALGLPAELRVRWTHRGALPAPAWPAPARRSYWQNLDRIEPRVVDDRVTHTVVAGGRVLLASSRQDDVTCVEVESGRVQWRFVCDGPVRYAPSVAGEQVFFGADDGFVRCVSLATGALRWRHRLGPAAPYIPGNGRLISPFPVRTGVVVAAGRVFACAGLFPMQGVFAAALDARTGERVWHHRLEKHSPQGYPLAAGELVVFPNGRANPFSLRRETGEAGPTFQGVGGSFAVIADEHLIAGRGNDATLAASRTADAERFVSFPGRDLVVLPGISIVIEERAVAALDRVRLNALRREQQALVRDKTVPAKRRKAELQRLAGEMAACALWREETSAEVRCAVAAGDTLYLGFPGRIERRAVRTGVVGASLPVDGEVVALAAAGGALVATTGDGAVHCLGAGDPVPVSPVAGARAARPAGDAAVEPWLAGFRNRRGYAVLVQPAGLAVVHDILAKSDMHVLVTLRGASAVAAAREKLRAAGLYGARVAVHELDGQALPYVDEFANLVVDLGAGALPAAEAMRIAVPGRGVVVRDGEVSRRPPLAGSGDWTHCYANPGNTAATADARITSDLVLQWFGGPGPRRMIDRHLRGPPPLAAGGRMFLVAENALIGVDAYNGTELWQLELPDSQRYSMPYDAGYIACDADRILAAVDAELWEIDAATGVVRRRVGVPEGVGRHWGYVALCGDAVYGSAVLPTAPRTKAGRREIDLAYRSERPLVTCRELFCLDAASMQARWRAVRGAVLHPTITLSGDRLVFVESRNPKSVGDATGRIGLATLLAADAWLVALDATTGELAWEVALDLPECRNILYLAAAEDRLVLVGSRDDAQKDARYHVRVLGIADGREIWRRDHGNQKPGQLYHGEQVHHPVILDGWVVAEPFVYRIEDGEMHDPKGGVGPWAIRRPGHSCGTMSGANGCLFFRADNPTVLDLRPGPGGGRFTRLAPSRAGCWINIIPACGLVLIPEASASCVCHYALQTSMAFRPR